MEKDEDNAYNAIDDSILNHENIINDTNHTEEQEQPLEK